MSRYCYKDIKIVKNSFCHNVSHHSLNVVSTIRTFASCYYRENSDTWWTIIGSVAHNPPSSENKVRQIMSSNADTYFLLSASATFIACRFHCQQALLVKHTGSASAWLRHAADDTAGRRVILSAGKFAVLTATSQRGRRTVWKWRRWIRQRWSSWPRRRRWRLFRTSAWIKSIWSG